MNSVIYEGFSCNDCQFKTLRQSCLKEHVEKQHNNISNFEANRWKTTRIHNAIEYECDECKFKVSKKADLSKHKKRMHNKTKNACDKCKEIHEKKVFRCGLCPFVSGTGSLLVEHYNSVHDFHLTV